MAYAPLTKIPQQFFDNLGNPLVSGTLYAYLAGTSTPTNMFSDNAGTVAGTSVVLDSRGEPTTFKLIWLNTAVIYKFVLKDSTGTTIWTIDNISGDDGTGNTASSVFDQQTLTATAGQTLFTLGYEYVTGTNAMAVYKNGSRLITGTDFTETSSTSVTLTMAAIAGDEYTFIGGQDVSSSFSGTNVSFIQSGTGAVTRSVQTKLRETVSVLDFGADSTGISDSTAAIQAALNTGKNVDLVGGQYKANNLTMSTNVQALVSSEGFARITKNANGPILTISANDCLVQNVGFRGDAATPVYTGDNIVVTGNSCRFLNCGSRYAYARALKISGNGPVIMGSGDIWQTADTTATGYDIELANASSVVQYAQLINIVSTQATGGILMTNTGSHVLAGGQIGKLTINTAGGPPAGVNGGMTTNMRILGDVTINQSTARFVGNQFGAVAISIGAGTSGVELDQSNSFQSGSTVVNSGNANNLVIREISGGSFNSVKFGADASNAVMDVYSGNGDTGQFGFRNGVWVNNNKTYSAKDSGGTLQNIAYISTGNANFISNTNGDTVLNAGTLLVFVAGGAGRWGIEANYLYPRADNVYSLGLGAYRPTVIYAVSGTINTSDAREKQQVRELSEAERAAAVRCKGLIRTFKWNDAVEKKGDAARIHFGVMAQDIKAAFEAEGLDADKYGLFCYDEWDAKDEVIDEDTGFVIQEARAAGNRYGVRYDQLLAFIISAI